MPWKTSRPNKAGYYFGRHQHKDAVPCEVYLKPCSTITDLMVWPVNSPNPMPANDDFWKGWQWLGPFTVADVERGLRIYKKTSKADEEIRRLKSENEWLHNHLDDMNAGAHQDLADFCDRMAKIQVEGICDTLPTK